VLAAAVVNGPAHQRPMMNGSRKLRWLEASSSGPLREMLATDALQAEGTKNGTKSARIQ
jgi:hypothetical protein